MASLPAYYEALVEDRGYEPADFGVGALPEAAVQRRFACAEGGREFADRLAAGERSLVTVGITMTGPPHVGTLGQLLHAIRFQDAGLDVQLVLADLVAYLGPGRDLAGVRELAEQYRAFATALGFDPDDGLVRRQETAPDVLHTALLLSRYFEPGGDGAGEEDDDATAGERDDDVTAGERDDDADGPRELAFEAELRAAYEATGTPGVETTRFAGEQASLLLVADTLEPVVERGYENVLFVGGADNHGLAGFVDDVLDAAPHEAHVGGLYGKLVGGFGGYPKMCKSIPDSRVTLDADPAVVRERVVDPGSAGDQSGDEDGLREDEDEQRGDEDEQRGDEDGQRGDGDGQREDDDEQRGDGGGTPAESLAYQMMQVASTYGPDELDRRREQCARGGAAWERAREAYAEFVLDCAAAWRSSDAGGRADGA